MAGNQFLKIDGIEGESTEAGFEGTIEVIDWSLGATNVGSSGIGGGMGTSNVEFDNFNFSMQMGKATPALLLATANGKHFPNAVLTNLKPTGEGNQQKFLEFTFTDLVFNNYSTGGHGGGDIPVDQLSFNFTGIQQEYFEQAPDGSLKSAGKTGWDVKTNQPK